MIPYLLIDFPTNRVKKGIGAVKWEGLEGRSWKGRSLGVILWVVGSVGEKESFLKIPAGKNRRRLVEKTLTLSRISIAGVLSPSSARKYFCDLSVGEFKEGKFYFSGNLYGAERVKAGRGYAVKIKPLPLLLALRRAKTEFPLSLFLEAGYRELLPLLYFLSKGREKEFSGKELLSYLNLQEEDINPLTLFRVRKGVMGALRLLKEKGIISSFAFTQEPVIKEHSRFSWFGKITVRREG